MKKKKILFIIWSFTYGGGAEKILKTIVNNLDSTKYEIDILEYWHSNINKESTNENISILKPLIDEQKDSKIKKIIYMFLLYFCPILLRKMYIKDDYDIEIAFNYLIPTFLLNRNKKKCKTISWMHGDIYDLKANKIKYFFQKYSLKKVDKIVAISDNTFNSVVDVYPEFENKLSLLYNGYNVEHIRELSNDKIDLKSKNKHNILFINRFDSNKNPLFVLDVLKRLLDSGLDVKLWFLGKGELETKIIEKTKQLNLNNNVEILGYKKNPYPYIKFCDVVLGCSKREGFPTIFIESLIIGKPFISTNVGGVKEISDDEKCGFIANSLDEYVSKLSMLLKDTKKYNKMSKCGKENVLKFSIDEQIRRIEKLFEEL